jgi:serine/threonine-protein kinase RsbW/stage II sporulation protein AB (anti-sigma F factor)
VTQLQPLVRRFPAQADQIAAIRNEFAAYGREHGVTDPAGLRLAISEAVTNVVLHAYIDAPAPGEIEVIAVRHPDDGFEVRVCDDGRGMKPRPDSPGMGVGLPLVASLVEHFEIEAKADGGTRLRMTFPVTS